MCFPYAPSIAGRTTAGIEAARLIIYHLLVINLKKQTLGANVLGIFSQAPTCTQLTVRYGGTATLSLRSNQCLLLEIADFSLGLSPLRCTDFENSTAVGPVARFEL